MLEFVDYGFFFFFQAEDGIRDYKVTGVQTCALPISLTLMLGPLEDALAEREHPLPEAQRERIDTAQRNGLRLLKLVNALLDFARIEGGRVQAHYQPTDLAALTIDLANTFRSAMQRAGLTL